MLSTAMGGNAGYHLSIGRAWRAGRWFFLDSAWAGGAGILGAKGCIIPWHIYHHACFIFIIFYSYNLAFRGAAVRDGMALVPFWWCCSGGRLFWCFLWEREMGWMGKVGERGVCIVGGPGWRVGKSGGMLLNLAGRRARYMREIAIRLF